MHPRELVELAALTVTHAPVLIDGCKVLSSTGIEQYWVTSRERLDHWGRAFKRYTATTTSSLDATRWSEVRPVLEEIFSGEMLTRVWTAILSIHDRRRDTSSVEPIARSILLGHLEARHRALALLVDDPSVDLRGALQLNRLRRRSERWTDFLLGYLLVSYDVSEFAIETERARDFADHADQTWHHPAARQLWALALASFTAAFDDAFHRDTVGNEVNARIASSVLACFPEELFDSVGLLRSLWSVRLSNIARDTQGMIEDLLRDESPTPGASSHARWPQQSRSRRRFKP